MAVEWEQIIIDSADPKSLGHWWREALDWVVVDEDEHVIEIRPAPDRLPGLLFVPSSEPKNGKNRLHIDLRPDNQETEVGRFVSLGARRIDIAQGDSSWVVLADPEGNEFCILSAPR